MLKVLDFILGKSPARVEETIRGAEFIINSNRALICNRPTSTKPDTDDQLKLFSTNSAPIFNAYRTIAAYAPLRAIKVLLELEKTLKPNAQAKFWKDANDHIQQSMKDAAPDVKKSVYRHIIDNAHKGQISEFLITHAANVIPMLTSDENTKNTDFFGTFLAHATPKTNEFLAAFEAELTAVYNQHPAHKLSLTKKILKACHPISGKDKNITLPDYVARMKDEQIREQAKRAVQLYVTGDNGFKQITNCLQELETLKASSCTTLKRLKGEKPTKVTRSPQVDKDDAYLYLYQLPTEGVTIPTSDATLPKHIYILATKPKGFGTPEDSGKLTAILASGSLDMVSKAFAVMPYDKDFQKVLAKMVAQFAPPPSYRSALREYPVTYLIDADSLSPSFKLTAGVDSLNLGNDKPSCTQIPWDIQPFQQHPARAV